ncbi:fasciclin domain-containing protein [Namhaeicola litoreus]|uniref:Fasciclin domain-containing protein n=1 Tax=Namhaeicola litoreus TaxID=1052145 RepID=A0ABW3Y588_9FLAO
MKIKNIYFIKSLLVLFLIAMISCDLEIQEEFKFEAEIPVLQGFPDLTAWDWIQTRTTPGATNPAEYAGEEFDYLIEAIQIAGMESEFSSSDPNRTYILLNNNAFTGGGDILELVTGSSTGNLQDADVELLKRLLQYHIVTTYIAQNDPLKVYGTYYSFQTLLPGSDGEITFRRDERLRLYINDSPDLPSTRANENVLRHNYVFKDGIGHIIQDYVRKVPF